MNKKYNNYIHNTYYVYYHTYYQIQTLKDQILHCKSLFEWMVEVMARQVPNHQKVLYCNNRSHLADYMNRLYLLSRHF